MNDESYEQAIQRLEATHTFPGPVLFKVIGSSDHDFKQRVVTTFREMLQLVEDPPFSCRNTPNGRYVSVTLEPQISSAAAVLSIYAEIRKIEGVILVL